MGKRKLTMKRRLEQTSPYFECVSLDPCCSWTFVKCASPSHMPAGSAVHSFPPCLSHARLPWPPWPPLVEPVQTLARVSCGALTGLGLAQLFVGHAWLAGLLHADHAWLASMRACSHSPELSCLPAWLPADHISPGPAGRQCDAPRAGGGGGRLLWSGGGSSGG